LLFLGIDLAASDRRPSGYCVLSSRDMSCRTGIAKRDEELLELALSARPRVVAIDAPLSFAANGGPFRRCDLEARRRGFMVLPLSMPSMAKLTARGVRLRRSLEERGLEVIEVFPTGGFRALGIEPPKRGLNKALEGLRRMGLKVENVENVHEVDAVMAAYIAYKYFVGEVEVVGDPVEGVIIVPRP
jgi:predicted nuclease with RNAse H fold